MAKIVPGQGGTLQKICSFLEQAEKRILTFDKYLKELKQIYIQLGIESDGGTNVYKKVVTGGGGLTEIDINTTKITDGTHDSTLADVVVWDKETQQWKFYAVFKPL